MGIQSVSEGVSMLYPKCPSDGRTASEISFPTPFQRQDLEGCVRQFSQLFRNTQQLTRCEEVRKQAGFPSLRLQLPSLFMCKKKTSIPWMPWKRDCRKVCAGYPRLCESCCPAPLWRLFTPPSSVSIWNSYKLVRFEHYPAFTLWAHLLSTVNFGLFWAWR